MNPIAARTLTTRWGAFLLNHVQPTRHPQLTMILLALDVVLGISVLDALIKIDLHIDAALDMAEAGILSVRTHQSCGIDSLPRPGKLTIAA